jgi:hypothetical protein
MKSFYHISPTKNRKSICKRGLIPAAGERSRRFQQFDERIYLLADLDSVHKLISIPMWRTHPDFENGFDIYKVEIGSQIKYQRDEKYEYGFYVEEKIRKVKLFKTIIK